VKLLLDTVTFLWCIQDNAALSKTARESIRDPSNDVWLSAVSAWEISIKNRLGKLPLPAPPAQFVPDQRLAHGFESLALDEDSTLHLTRLPDVHRDPFDRMLICQAIAGSLTIVTPDEQFTHYPVRSIW